MGFLDRFKNKEDKSAKGGSVSKTASSNGGKKVEGKSAKSVVKKKPVTVKTNKPASAKGDVKIGKTEGLKGKTNQAYQVLIKPLVTEKASELGILNKYVFAVNRRMNKIEIKKAVRSIYNVDPVSVNILNFSGKNVRFGRIKGKTKAWKKAVITLRPGDKIEIYEGV